MFNCITDILMQDTFLVVIYALIFFKRGRKNHDFHLQWEQQKVRRINVRDRKQTLNKYDFWKKTYVKRFMKNMKRCIWDIRGF